MTGTGIGAIIGASTNTVTVSGSVPEPGSGIETPLPYNKDIQPTIRNIDGDTVKALTTNRTSTSIEHCNDVAETSDYLTFHMGFRSQLGDDFYGSQ